MLRLLAERLQLDRTLSYALASRVWQAATGPVTIALIIGTLSKSEQGVYYGIIPIIGIQAFFELGLLNVLISQAGHANEAVIAANQAGDVEAVEKAASRMRELIRASRRWFSWASAMFAAAALAFGWHTFTKSGVESGWQTPFLSIVPLAALNVYFAPSLAILEGAGYRNSVYRFRFFQMMAGSLAVWIALLYGLGIWALVIATAIQLAFLAYMTVLHQGEFFRRFDAARSDDQHFSWARDVLPQQWRVAAIGIAYHLATQFLAIVVLTYHGAVESGRLGMSLSITTAIQMLALAWVQTKFPIISSLHGRGEREDAGTMWRQTALISSGLLVGAFTAFIVLLLALPVLERGWESRFVEPAQLAILGIGCVANHFIAIQGFYVLARGTKPLVVSSVIGLLTTAAAVWIAGYYRSTTGVVVAFTCGMALVTLPLHTIAYLRSRMESTENVA